jgi:hypothetical protein
MPSVLALAVGGEARVVRDEENGVKLKQAPGLVLGEESGGAEWRL